MAAYAALVSLMNNLEQIKNHPSLSTSLDKYQTESLHEKVDFLLDFLENCLSRGSKEEIEDLESQIASAAHEAEDVIESHIVDQIQDGITHIVNFAHLRCLLGLQKVILDIDAIKEKVVEVKDKWGLIKDEKTTNSMSDVLSRPLTSGKNTMVGFDDELIQLMDMLTGQESSTQIISIIGMGGIGKTTLAKSVYDNLVIIQHFDVRAWATISQEYSVTEVLLELLSGRGKSVGGTVDELGKQLYQSLFGRRYLIILDDMWSVEVWDKMKFFFPNNGNRSRVIITSRLSNVAIYCGSYCFRMNFLDEDKSWNLFLEKVFGHEDCPPELLKIGKRIVGQCKGLPLSIVVIGGLLRKSDRTNKYWQNVAENINDILNSGENEQVLFLSYSHLPPHLKPCFLYLGIFPEDDDIRVSELIKLWIAEGFLKSNGAKLLEEVAEGYLQDLIDRNLILVGRLDPNGNIKTCRIHDLLRDLCLRIAEKEKFFYVVRELSISVGIDMERRLVFLNLPLEADTYQVFDALPSISLARSLVCRGDKLSVNYRLLRVMHRAHYCSLEDIVQNVNLRYFAYHPSSTAYRFMLSSSLSLLWNLQTLIIRAYELIVAPIEIWNMPQLRHIKCDKIFFSDIGEQDGFFALRNLQTLTKVVNFKWSEEACKRIPNVRKLHIIYGDIWKGYYDCTCDYLCNLHRLHKLESLNMIITFYDSSYPGILLKNLTLPSSLNKLSLRGCRFHWDDLTLVIDSLPQLQVLKLEKSCVVGSEWITANVEFPRLKYLRIDSCDLRTWTADGSHFPVLEKLVLRHMYELDEVSLGIGEIPTLELIRLDWCSESAVISAVKIKEELESLGNDGLQIQVKISPFPSKRLRKSVEREGLTIYNSQLEEDW